MERISQAAIKVGAIVNTLPPPHRHGSIMSAAVYYCRGDGRGFESPLVHGEQGFVTDTGRFVDRVEALQIARAADQCIRETAPHVGLFSEDLW